MKKIFLVTFLLSLTAGAFERLALVDGFDYANIFDTETASGNRQVLDHVLLTGANTILWRNCSGGLMRYPSAEERLPLAANPLDMRRLPDSRVPFGWLNYHLAQPDIIRDMMDECAKRGLARGIHWPYEETHWSNWTLGAWNLAHPQFWGVTANGKPWSGRTSLAFPEVRAHKLRLLDELLARGADIIYIDLFRNGGWGPQYEYVKPNIEAWRTRHGGEPPTNPRDPRWLALVAESQHAFFRAVRARLEKQPRKVRLILGIMNARTDGDNVYESRAIDWRRLTDEGILDGVAVMSVVFDPKDAWNSTRAIYRSFASVRGKVRVYFPVAAYNYSQAGIPAYVKATGESPAQVAKHLTELAREYGDGIVMECVDYKNYPPDVCAAMTNETIRGAARVQARAEILGQGPSANNRDAISAGRPSAARRRAISWPSFRAIATNMYALGVRCTDDLLDGRRRNVVRAHKHLQYNPRRPRCGVGVCEERHNGDELVHVNRVPPVGPAPAREAHAGLAALLLVEARREDPRRRGSAVPGRLHATFDGWRTHMGSPRACALFYAARPRAAGRRTLAPHGFER